MLASGTILPPGRIDINFVAVQNLATEQMDLSVQSSVAIETVHNQCLQEFLWTFANTNLYPCKLITYCDSMRGGYGKTYHLSLHKRSDHAILRDQGPHSIKKNRFSFALRNGLRFLFDSDTVLS